MSETPTYDAVNHPRHYNSHPSGVEVITVTEHMNFCLGNAVKYILRCDYKGTAVQDLEKAKWYIERELERRHRQSDALHQGLIEFENQLIEEGVVSPDDRYYTNKDWS